MDERRKKAVAVLVVACGATVIQQQRKKRKKRIWIKPWLQCKNRSAYNMILNELSLHDQQDFRKYLRMNTDTFEVSFILFLFHFI